MADSLRVARVAELAAGQLAEVDVIYRQAFPPQLRVPFPGLAVDGPRELLQVGLEGAGPVAFAASMLLEEYGWVFLRYYGVAAARRRQGLGQRFWPLLRAALRRAGWPDRIVFEVEDPAHAQDERERRVCLGRIEFWRSCGCALLPIPGYVMPDFTGLAQPEPMLLMAAGLDASPGPQAGQLAQVVRAIYAGRYGLESSDPLVVSALATITA
ncbi:MAG: hypothetical protein ABJB47_06225 [Actinomycetota bacterium]